MRDDANSSLWSKLAEPLPNGAVSWRQDGKPVQRGAGYVARFVAYVEANTVRERLDAVVPGEWDLTLELLPQQANEDGEPQCSFKARLQILGVVREDVGHGKDYKSAATDAFKRAGVRYGIAHELYSYDQNWVKVESDSKYAKPLEDPGEAYARRQSSGAKAGAVQGHTSGAPREAAAPAPSPAVPPPGYDTNAVPEQPSCPKCEGKMWDNRLTKRNPKAPDWKCRDKECDGVVWPPKPNAAEARRFTDADKAAAKRVLDLEPVPDDEFPPPLDEEPLF